MAWKRLCADRLRARIACSERMTGCSDTEVIFLPGSPSPTMQPPAGKELILQTKTPGVGIPNQPITIDRPHPLPRLLHRSDSVSADVSTPAGFRGSVASCHDRVPVCYLMKRKRFPILVREQIGQDDKRNVAGGCVIPKVFNWIHRSAGLIELRDQHRYGLAAPRQNLFHHWILIALLKPTLSSTGFILESIQSELLRRLCHCSLDASQNSEC